MLFADQISLCSCLFYFGKEEKISLSTLFILQNAVYHSYSPMHTTFICWEGQSLGLLPVTKLWLDNENCWLLVTVFVPSRKLQHYKMSDLLCLTALSEAFTLIIWLQQSIFSTSGRRIHTNQWHFTTMPTGPCWPSDSCSTYSSTVSVEKV